jgi:hypothetical protein
LKEERKREERQDKGEREERGEGETYRNKLNTL